MKKDNFIIWFIFNIFLPLMPVFIKLSISFFGDPQKIIVTILDSAEFLYFNFILCVSFLYEIATKEKLLRIEYLMGLVIFSILIVDIVLLMLIYGGQGAVSRISYASAIMSILITCVVIAKRLNWQVLTE